MIQKCHIFDLAEAESRPMFQLSALAFNGIYKCRKLKNMAMPDFLSWQN